MLPAAVAFRHLVEVLLSGGIAGGLCEPAALGRNWRGRIRRIRHSGIVRNWCCHTRRSTRVRGRLSLSCGNPGSPSYHRLVDENQLRLLAEAGFTAEDLRQLAELCQLAATLAQTRESTPTGQARLTDFQRETLTDILVHLPSRRSR
jgi:hypothetical protein